ncbi:MAG: DUF998 domain-containing protein [Acidobacteriota bacterium]|jgi:hypothetical protein
MEDYVATLARITIAATVCFFAVMYVAFVFIQPELNPLNRFGSEYAVGRMGWLMKLAFFCWSAGLAAFAVALLKGLDPEARSRISVVLFMIGAAGIFVSGMYDSDLQIPNDDPPPRWVEAPASEAGKVHDLAGLTAFFAIMPGAGLVTRRLRLAGRLRGRYRLLRALSWLTPVAFVAFVAVFIPRGLAGLGQRIFLALVFAWLIIAARGLEDGTFSPRGTAVAGDS